VEIIIGLIGLAVGLLSAFISVSTRTDHLLKEIRDLLREIRDQRNEPQGMMSGGARKDYEEHGKQ
jgi:hypothetical protein